MEHRKRKERDAEADSSARSQPADAAADGDKTKKARPRQQQQSEKKEDLAPQNGGCKHPLPKHVVERVLCTPVKFAINRILAPMVGGSDLPFRMLCRKFGAQACYTPMMYADKFVRDPEYRRREFATCAGDSPLVAHFCGNDPAVLLAAARMCEPVVDAIDLNLGCPQRIAHAGHFGSYLLDDCDRGLVLSIVSTLARSLSVPVCCKIRLLPELDATVEFVRQLERAGCALVAVHARFRGSPTRRRDGPALLDWVREIKRRADVRIPVVTNGNVRGPRDVLANQRFTGADGVMVAEALLDNPALFAEAEAEAEAEEEAHGDGDGDGDGEARKGGRGRGRERDGEASKGSGSSGGGKGAGSGRKAGAAADEEEAKSSSSSSSSAAELDSDASAARALKLARKYLKYFRTYTNLEAPALALQEEAPALSSSSSSSSSSGSGSGGNTGSSNKKSTMSGNSTKSSGSSSSSISSSKGSGSSGPAGEIESKSGGGAKAGSGSGSGWGQVSLSTVVFHVRRMCGRHLQRFQLFDDLLGAADVSAVEAIVARALALARAGGFEPDPEKQKRIDLARAETKRLAELRHKYEERMRRRAKREGMLQDLDFYIRQRPWPGAPPSAALLAANAAAPDYLQETGGAAANAL